MPKLNKDKKMTSEQIEKKCSSIGAIIERMANNHFKWYIMHIAVFSLFISFYSFALKWMEIDNKLQRWVVSISIGVAINSISIIVFINSWNFLQMERAWRNMQNKTREGCEPSYKWKDYKEKGKYGFVFWTELLFCTLLLIITIVFPIIFL